MSIHRISVVERCLPADVRGQIELDLTESGSDQVELYREYAAKYPEEFAKFSDRAFYRWCKKYLDDVEKARQEVARERLRAVYAIRNSVVAKASLKDLEEAAQRNLHDHYAAIAANPEIDVKTLKEIGGLIDSIGVLGRLSINRDKLSVLQAENERAQEKHEAAMAAVKAEITNTPDERGDGTISREKVFAMIDKAMRGEAV